MIILFPVHKLTPGDIGVIGAMGDSITVSVGYKSGDININSSTEREIL